MTELETIVRTGLSDLADEVRPVDLRARVAFARRRRRTRLRVVALGAAAAVAAGTTGAVVLWPDPAPKEDLVAEQVESWLPAEIDLAAARPVAAEDSLQMIFQTVGADKTTQTFGLVAGSDDVVLLADLAQRPRQLSSDGTRALLHGFDPDGPPPVVVDLRSGETTAVPWQDDYRAAGMSPDGGTVAVATLSAELEPPCDTSTANPCSGTSSEPQLTAWWGLTFVDLDTGTTRAVELPPSLELDGVASDPFASPPTWSPDGDTVVVTLSSGGALVPVVVAIDGRGAWVASTSPTGAAPWSADGALLVVDGDAPSAYRVIDADPASAETGAILASGPTRGRRLLGWAAEDRLLWYDPGLGALVETALSGEAIGTPVPVNTDDEVQIALLAPPGGA
jgi:hypothetical protein